MAGLVAGWDYAIDFSGSVTYNGSASVTTVGKAFMASHPPLIVGYKASAEQFGPRELVDLAVEAEKTGFESAFVSDHFQPWRHDGGHAPFSLTWLAAAGAKTSTIILGTSVLTPTFRYNPAVIAQAFGSLGVLFPERVILGIGTGEALNEYATGFQGPWPEFKERFARLKEAIELISQLWTGEETNFSGEYYHTKGAFLYDIPEKKIPIYIAAGGPTMAKFAGRRGDGFICTSGKGAELYTEQLIPGLQEGASKAGRDVATIDAMIEIKISYDRDPALALENTRFWAPLSLTAEQKTSVNSSREMERLANELPIEQVAKRWIVASTPEEAIQGIQPYLDAGFNHLVFHAPGHDQQKFFTEFGDDVLPLLKQG